VPPAVRNIVGGTRPPTIDARKGDDMTTLLDLRPDPLVQRFTDWMEGWDPFRRDGLTRRDHLIRVEETMHDGVMTIRAEVPGIDPDDDIDISVADGVLTISAERTVERSNDDDGGFSEFRYGSFRRTLGVPTGTKPDDIAADYEHGILTISVPMPKAKDVAGTKIPVRTH
jgi:HSP20 family protein